MKNLKFFVYFFFFLIFFPLPYMGVLYYMYEQELVYGYMSSMFTHLILMMCYTDLLAMHCNSY